ncbi:DUF3159 domain-containing protein [Nocardioidaceae bacterium SCSIO 66511]|nr:DUF3159 domain-containing protein [Nocardioidaceae bacterium SCSIO 66511]
MPDAAGGAPTEETVEAVVRGQLSKALGGVRGMVEAAVPTILFTIVFLSVRELKPALIVSITVAAVLLVVRIVQRSTVQFAVNSLVGIGIGAFFAWRSARGGGDESDQALAYFLPGILYNAGYAVAMILSIVVRWPVVGFLVGSVTGDPTAWRENPQIVKLCRNLTWLLVLPCIVRVVIQAPMYLAGSQDLADKDLMVAMLGTAKIALGWPLQVAALLAMVYLLSRNHTPVRREAD